MRSDNGPPLASLGCCGLSRLAVWWIRLGIESQRIEEGGEAAVEVGGVLAGHDGVAGEEAVLEDVPRRRAATTSNALFSSLRPRRPSSSPPR